MISEDIITVTVLQLISANVIGVAFFSLLITLPFHILAYILLFIGNKRTQHVEENIFHRVVNFCENNIVGKLLLAISLFSPTIFIFCGSIFLFPDEIIGAILIATLPWMISSIFALAVYKNK